MWRSLWRSFDRFSLYHFKHVINELRQIKVVENYNRELVVDLLQSVVEIVAYGDRQDPLIFECFMEYQVLAEFVRLLKISRNSRIEAPLLQYLSIMLQNMDSEHAIYYCFSNDYVNNIIAHNYKFDAGDLAQYYISFLRAVSSKINRDTLCLLVKVQGDVVVSFPLYNEALKFAQHGEKMIQTAVRALTLNIYNVSDDMVFQFITTPPVSNYFSDLVHGLKEQCIDLDKLVHSKEEMSVSQRRKEVLFKTDKIVDDLYYLKDIICISESRLSEVVTQNLLDLLVCPILLPLLQLRHNDGLNLSAVTSLYICSRILQVIGGKGIANFMAELILYPSKYSRSESTIKDGENYSSFNHSNGSTKLLHTSSKFAAEDNNGRLLCGDLAESTSCNSQIADHSVVESERPERRGILAHVFSENVSLQLASLFLLLTLANSKDLEHFLPSTVCSNMVQQEMNHDISCSFDGRGSILVKFLPEILGALLKILASEAPTSALIQWHVGWFLKELLLFQGSGLDDHTTSLFNTSYNRASENIQKEVDGCCFDYVLNTIRSEWAKCRTALGESIQSKDPIFIMELIFCEQTSAGDVTSSYVAWQRMVDVVKVFVLHLQLNAFICKEELPEKLFLDSTDASPVNHGKTHASDLSSASFGSEVSLGSAIPCRIAFSNAGIRDIHLIPVVNKTSGKLLLVEKHPFRGQRGVVIAVAPLAGLDPKINKDHPTWLHLRIREFDPRSTARKPRDFSSKVPNHTADGRWTLGFPNTKACEAAQSMILEETRKQRSYVRSTLDQLLKINNQIELTHDEAE